MAAGKDGQAIKMHTYFRYDMAFIKTQVHSMLLYMMLHTRAPQLKKVCFGSEVGSNMDQNKPFWLGFRSFASKLMDRNSIKVFVFGENQSPKNRKTEMGLVRFMKLSGKVY